jgi:DNA-binding MarR family transcriptional regulator
MNNTHSFFKLIYILKRLTDNWGDAHLQTIIPEFRMAYMPVFISVSHGITSNVAIANDLHITKMAVSKMITGLTKLNLISSSKDQSDGRSLRLSLTEKGREFLKEVTQASEELEKGYKKVIGKDAFSGLVSNLGTIQAFHEQKLDK